MIINNIQQSNNSKNDFLNKYFWEKLVYDMKTTGHGNATGWVGDWATGASQIPIIYGDSITLNEETGELTIINGINSTVSLSQLESLAPSVFPGKYVYINNKYRYFPDNNISFKTVNSGIRSFYAPNHTLRVAYIKSAEIYLLSDSEDTYSNDINMKCYGKLGTKIVNSNTSS